MNHIKGVMVGVLFHFQEQQSSFSEESTYVMMPSVMGCFIADRAGLTILRFELFEGALDYYLKEVDEDNYDEGSFDIEIIPMFFSAMEKFARRIHVHDFIELPLNGSNIKMHSLFCFEHFILVFFLHPDCRMERIKFHVIKYFTFFFEEHGDDLKNISMRSSFQFKSLLEQRGRRWLMNLNQNG